MKFFIAIVVLCIPIIGEPRGVPVEVTKDLAEKQGRETNVRIPKDLAEKPLVKPSPKPSRPPSEEKRK